METVQDKSSLLACGCLSWWRVRENTHPKTQRHLPQELKP